MKFLILVILLVTTHIFSKTVVIDIYGEIDLGLPLTVERGVEYAKEIDADKILFRMNTFGGRVDAATEIKDVILDCKIPTYIFINNRAISAGALISFACDTIVMTKSSTIGASTPVNQKGEKLSEKFVSFMRAEMRSTLEAKNKNPIIGEAMVDENLELDSIAPKGKLLTLTSIEAKKRGVADTLIDNFDNVKKYLNESDFEYITESFKEKFIRLLSNPFVSSILLSLGILGIFFELRTPGLGFPGIIGLSSLTLFISSHYLLRLANGFEILLIIIGIVLILLEIFVIPGFGIAGILGICATIAGFYLSMISSMPVLSDYYVAGYSLSFVFILVLVLSYITFKTFIKSKFYKENSLQNYEKIAQLNNLLSKDLIGEVAITKTILRPSGKIDYNDKLFDAVSRGEYIENGVEVKIIDIKENNYVVKVLKEEN